MTAIKTHLASFLTLGLLAVIGAFLTLAATPEGLGLSDDSIAYIAGARSLLAGEGYREAWLESNQPVTHFPPAFSGTLALMGVMGVNPINGAHLLNALLFGVNAALLGLLGWRMTKSSMAGMALAALFIVNDSLLRVHAVAMSEPLFLFFSLLVFLFFPFYFETNKSIWLLVSGLLASFAYLTRYSGLALVATCVVALILLNDTWKKRLASAAIFLAGFMPLALAWNVRNRLVAGNATNRTLLWHPVTADTLKQGLRTCSEFLVPVEEWRRELFQTSGIFVGVIVFILLAVLLWIVVNGLRRFFQPSTPMPEVIGFTSGLYIFGYLASVLFSISLFDASTPLKVRILAPVYLPLLLLLVNAGVWMWRLPSSSTTAGGTLDGAAAGGTLDGAAAGGTLDGAAAGGTQVRAAVALPPPSSAAARETRKRFGHAGQALVIGLGALIFSVSALGQARTVASLAGGGQGFASFKWYDSKVMQYLKTLDGIAIYTNEPGAVYLYTGRGCRVLPSRVDPVTGLTRADFEAGVEQIREEVRSGRAVLALFDANLRNPDYAVLTDGLTLVMKLGGDVVYAAPR